MHTAKLRTGDFWYSTSAFFSIDRIIAHQDTNFSFRPPLHLPKFVVFLSSLMSFFQAFPLVGPYPRIWSNECFNSVLWNKFQKIIFCMTSIQLHGNTLIFLNRQSFISSHVFFVEYHFIQEMSLESLKKRETKSSENPLKKAWIHFRIIIWI